jgi:hypothetical protein
MAHLSPQTQQRSLARALDRREIVAATEHLRECESCRENATVLRRSRPGSLLEQVLPGTSIEDHPQEDLLVAFVDSDVTPADRLFGESLRGMRRLSRDPDRSALFSERIATDAREAVRAGSGEYDAPVRQCDCRSSPTGFDRS